MSALLLQWTINALAIILAVKTIPGMSFHGKWWYMLILGALFGVINSFIRPIMRFFMYPVILLTLGIFTIIINASMLAFTAVVSSAFNLGLVIDGFWPAFSGSLVVSMVSAFLSWLIGPLGGRDSEGNEKRSS